MFWARESMSNICTKTSNTSIYLLTFSKQSSNPNCTIYSNTYPDVRASVGVTQQVGCWYKDTASRSAPASCEQKYHNKIM